MSDALDNARAAAGVLEAEWRGAEHVAEPEFAAVQALRDLIAEHERLTTLPADDERESLSVHLAAWDSGEAFQTSEDAERDGQNMVWWRAVANSALVWFRRQGPVTEEWEYGLTYGDEDSTEPKRMKLERARAKASSAFGDQIFRRRIYSAPDPGPWEPVEAEGNP